MNTDLLKSRLLAVAILAIALAALYFGLARPHISTIPKQLDPLAEIKPAMPAPPEPPPLVIPPTPTIAPPPLPEPTFTLPPVKPAAP